MCLFRGLPNLGVDVVYTLLYKVRDGALSKETATRNYPLFATDENMQKFQKTTKDSVNFCEYCMKALKLVIYKRKLSANC